MFDHAPVRGDSITGRQQDDVARHEVRGVNLVFLTVTQHASDGDSLLLERLERDASTPLGDEADDSVDDDHHQDRDRLHRLAEE